MPLGEKSGARHINSPCVIGECARCVKLGGKTGENGGAKGQTAAENRNLWKENGELRGEMPPGEERMDKLLLMALLKWATLDR